MDERQFVTGKRNTDFKSTKQHPLHLKPKRDSQSSISTYLDGDDLRDDTEARQTVKELEEDNNNDQPELEGVRVLSLRKGPK